MEYNSDRSKVEIRENEIFSKNKSLLRGDNIQTVGYNKINKVEKYKWSTGKYYFFVFGFLFFGMGFGREESIGGGDVLIHNTIDDWVIRGIIVGSVSFVVFIILGMWFNSKFGKNISLYLKYNIGSKKVSRSIYTTESSQEIDEIIEKITSKL